MPYLPQILTASTAFRRDPLIFLLTILYLMTVADQPFTATAGTGFDNDYHDTFTDFT
jgi:hypothetical protein